MRKNIEKAYYWPKWFISSLIRTERQRISTPKINKLCVANLYLWRALNLYDDFLDGEGVPKDLPLANSYYRRFLDIYYRLELSSGFYKIFDEILNDLDNANREETSSEKLKIKNGQIYYPRRLPGFNDLKVLSRKSLALGLGSIAVLDIIGGRDKNKKIRRAINFFRYALAAKQLSDDSCDWLDDLLAGAITPANALVLRAAKTKNISLNFKKDKKTFYLLFINSAAQRISVEINNLCFHAQQEGLKIGLTPKSPLIKGLIGPMKMAVKKAEMAQKIIL